MLNIPHGKHFHPSRYIMKNKLKKVYERVYIHAAKVQTKEGWTLIINAMDAYSEYAFKPVSSKNTKVTIDVLNQLFDNILEGYKPLVHPKQITFVTSLPEEHTCLFQQTKVAQHRFKFDMEAKDKAMKGLLSTISHEFSEL